MHLLAERFVFWGWWSGFGDRGSQDLSNGTNVASYCFFSLKIYSLWETVLLAGPSTQIDQKTLFLVSILPPPRFHFSIYENRIIKLAPRSVCALHDQRYTEKERIFDGSLDGVCTRQVNVFLCGLMYWNFSASVQKMELIYKKSKINMGFLFSMSSNMARRLENPSIVGHVEHMLPFLV